MNFHISISRTTPFSNLGVLGGIFHYYSHSYRIFCDAASDHVLHCLPVSFKKDARPIWVNSSNVAAWKGYTSQAPAGLEHPKDVRLGTNQGIWTSS